MTTGYWIAVWDVLAELAPWLLLGTGIAGLLHVALPQDFVTRHLRGRGGVGKAVLLGVPMPLCSCGVIPAGLGLKRDGASDGAAVGFLISTPQTGVDSILVSASFLGLPFALFKLASATVMGLVGGWLADRVSAEPEAAAALTGEPEEPRPRTLAGAWQHALEILRSVWRWLVFGVLVSAAITVFVPDQALVALGRFGGLGAALAALAISLPLYVCATASVPIAAALVGAGMPAGAALVFLMAGPASNVATIGAIFRGFGARILAVYLATIGIGSVGFGLLFDGVLSGVARRAPDAHVHVSWWAQLSAVALVVLLARFAVEDLRRLLRRAPKGDGVVTIEVAGLSCQNCVKKLEAALAGAAGVTAVAVTLETGTAVVQGSVEESSLREIVRGAGYQPV